MSLVNLSHNILQYTKIFGFYGMKNLFCTDRQLLFFVTSTVFHLVFIYFENQSSTCKKDFSFTSSKSETLRVTRIIPLEMAVAAI